MAKKTTRLSWSKLPVPPELSDMLYMIAKNKGYQREQIHYFLYHLVRTVYPEDVEGLNRYFELSSLEELPPPPDD